MTPGQLSTKIYLRLAGFKLGGELCAQQQFILRSWPWRFAAGSASSAPATATGVLITTVTAENLDPTGKVPTLNGVPGSAVGNVDIATPQAILVHGTTYFYGITSQNNNFSGVCKDSFRLTQVQSAKTVVLDSSIINKGYDCKSGETWFWVKTGKAVPVAPGPATLTGTVAYGTSKVSMSVHVLIQ